MTAGYFRRSNPPTKVEGKPAWPQYQNGEENRRPEHVGGKPGIWENKELNDQSHRQHSQSGKRSEKPGDQQHRQDMLRHGGKMRRKLGKGHVEFLIEQINLTVGDVKNIPAAHPGAA